MYGCVHIYESSVHFINIIDSKLRVVTTEVILHRHRVIVLHAVQNCINVIGEIISAENIPLIALNENR